MRLKGAGAGKGLKSAGAKLIGAGAMWLNGAGAGENGAGASIHIHPDMDGSIQIWMDIHPEPAPFSRTPKGGE